MAPLTGAAIASCGILLLLLVPWAQGQGQPPEASEEAWAEGQPPEASEEPGFLFSDSWGPFLLIVAAGAGFLALILMLRALAYLCTLVCRLRRWCKNRATAYVSAARVTPHGQQER